MHALLPRTGLIYGRCEVQNPRRVPGVHRNNHQRRLRHYRLPRFHSSGRAVQCVVPAGTLNPWEVDLAACRVLDDDRRYQVVRFYCKVSALMLIDLRSIDLRTQIEIEERIGENVRVSLTSRSTQMTIILEQVRQPKRREGEGCEPRVHPEVGVGRGGAPGRRVPVVAYRNNNNVNL